MTFKPLLSGTAPKNLSKLRYPVLVSPKLDGIRCLIRGGIAVSRTLKAIPNLFVQSTLAKLNLPDGFDGELLLSDPTADFNKVSSAIMSRTGEPDFVYAVFDWVLTDLRFQSRLAEADRFINQLKRRDRTRTGGQLSLPRISDHIELVPHEEAVDEEQVWGTYMEWTDQGYEGLMMRDPDGAYKQGRSTVKEQILLKLKPWEDDEALVVGVVEQMHNTNELEKDNLGHAKRSTKKEGMVGKGTMGALLCRMDDGTVFRLGTGFNDAMRQQIWDSVSVDEGVPCHDVFGATVKFRHQPPPSGRAEGQAPRFPKFLGFRHEDDR